MCAINPVHKKRIILDFYTSDATKTKESFEERIISICLRFEQQVNAKTKLRLHVKETNQEAD